MRTADSARNVDLLRFTTAGSVDDGKSTLIGRLLCDTQSILDDQLHSVTAASQRFGEDALNLALFTDGLRFEREQNITIDVAYRHFATARRRFIVADTPGHIEYTRNMVTGASTADLAIVLVDATRGVLNQSRRHAFLATLLGIPHLIVAVNKMDLVDYAESVYDEIVSAFSAFASKLTIKDITCIPVSALQGDNVVFASARMPWYQGGTLLHRLETAHVGARNAIDFRFPVQTVIRPNQRFRGYAGSVASGSVRVGDEVTILPGGFSTAIKSIETYDGPRESADCGDAIVITLDDELDVSRGDMVARRQNLPMVCRALDAYLCWMSPEPLAVGATYWLAHTSRRVQARVDRVQYRVDIDTMHRDAAVTTLQLNDIGRARLTLADPVFVDSYHSNTETGSFILIDSETNATVGAGMIRGAAQPAAGAQTGRVSPGVVWQPTAITREMREAQNGHRAAVVWFTGLPGAGKTTIAQAVEGMLFEGGHSTQVLDGDNLRHGLCGDLGFSPTDRSENIRRAGAVARLFFDHGALVLCAFVSPYRADRDAVRAQLPAGRFVEVLVTADEATRRARDPKRHYAEAAAGRLEQFTGVSAPYEASAQPDLVIDTTRTSVANAAGMVMQLLVERGWVKRV